jgi:RNase P/RNase MRP subunit p30
VQQAHRIKIIAVLGFKKSRCSFATSDFPEKNLRTQNHNYTSTILL